ncbi:MAG: glycerol-3-phosphate responsive antiterminator [Lachnospiraceae bacterium]|nr:glycerol-3-phosphate responsive antiterminator [Lachnospiraceae bacterium]
MNRNQILKKIKEKRIIAAVKDDEGLKCALETDIGVVFVLYGDVLSLEDTVKSIRDSGKAAIVHMDLITGLSPKEISVDYVKTRVRADGIISTKQTLIKRAKELGMFTVMRFFVLDSMALVNLNKQCSAVIPDCIEILPGLMPKIIRRLVSSEPYPLIAGGLISDDEDITSAIEAGAIAVSTTNMKLICEN